MNELQNRATAKPVDVVKSWYNAQFLPWKQEMQRYRAQQQNQISILQNQKQRLQYLIGLVLNGKYDDAVTGWNALGLQPKLKSLALDSTTGMLVLIPINGKTVEVDINTLITEMQELLAQ